VAGLEGIPPLSTLWRISNYADLSGEGSRGGSARWHTEGSLVVYLAESPASAMLERIVHLTDRDEGGILPRFYQLLQISVPEDCATKPLSALAPSDWREHAEFTRGIGDAWLASLETPLARVPSAIVPHTWNYLLNPLHPDAGKLQIAEVIRERFDNRLFGFAAQ
jgi:RES domain-containing protein